MGAVGDTYQEEVAKLHSLAERTQQDTYTGENLLEDFSLETTQALVRPPRSIRDIGYLETDTHLYLTEARIDHVANNLEESNTASSANKSFYDTLWDAFTFFVPAQPTIDPVRTYGDHVIEVVDDDELYTRLQEETPATNSSWHEIGRRPQTDH